MRLLSLGAGVQSSAICLLAAEGKLPSLNGAIFADTGWEPQRVYDHLNRLALVLFDAGVPLHIVSSGDLRHDSINPVHRYASIPYYVRNPDGSEGMGRRQCTSEYKLKPIGRKVRELLGAKAPRYLRVPKGAHAEQWIGFSTDEIHRVSDKYPVSYVTKVYPLLDLGWSRDDCRAYLTERGFPETPKSACIGCPFHGNQQWRELRDNHPDEWADAIAFDESIRRGGARGLPLDGQAFLHRSRVPLPLAPIDHVTKPRKRAAHDAAELGDPDGCSPYGCRSGVPA